MSPEIYLRVTGKQIIPYTKRKRSYKKLEGTIELIDKNDKVAKTISIPHQRAYESFYAAWKAGEYPGLEWRWKKD